MNGQRTWYLSQQHGQYRRVRSFGSRAASLPLEEDFDDDIALFNEMRKREKKKEECRNEDIDLFRLRTSAGRSSPVLKVLPAAIKCRPNDLLNGDEKEKNDYDWLLTPPDTPMFSSSERETLTSSRSRAPGIRQLESAFRTNKANLRSSDIEPRAETLQPLRASRQSSVSTSSRSGASKRPTSSTATRPSTPTSRPTGPITRSLSVTSTRSVASYRPITSALRPSSPPARQINPPTSRSTPPSRASTPTSTPAAPRAVQPATPAKRPSMSNGMTITSVPPGRSSSVTKIASMVSRKNPSVSSRGCSPTLKTRPWEPSEMPGFSLETPPNLRTTMPERPSSATRGRPTAPTGQSSKELANPTASSRRSCSPSLARGRILSDRQNSEQCSIYSTKSNVNANGVSGILGSKMVEKLMYARRAAPKLQDDQMSIKSASSATEAKRPVKPTLTSDSSRGFGRTLSKNSLDMAVRHMDIGHSGSTALRSPVSNIPSFTTARSGRGRRVRSTSISDSPLATSSNTSSDLSMNILLNQEGSEFDDEEFVSEKGGKASLLSQQDSAHSKDEPASANYLHSLVFKDNHVEHSFF